MSGGRPVLGHLFLPQPRVDTSQSPLVFLQDNPDLFPTMPVMKEIQDVRAWLTRQVYLTVYPLPAIVVSFG